ncbi:MAG: dTDP-4-dehydrorhamnose 3,5-epimerase [Caulobacterales bacterium]
MIERLALADVFVINGSLHADARGSFSETYRASVLAEAGVEQPFVQENLVRTKARGTLRGLHFQRDPFAQDKLVQVLDGAIFDVAVDIRPSSPTLGRWVGLTLTADEPRQIFVPRGFAHGYVTLSDDCAVTYKTTAYYAPQAEAGIRWDDAAVAIDWPLPAGEISANARDLAWPPFAAAIGP